MISLAQARELVAVVVPVYFLPTVEKQTIARILEVTFADQLLFCSPQRSLVVVDHNTPAEAVLQQAQPGSPLHALPLHILDKNRGKAGAIQAGLSELLKRTDASYLVTRDCDGDHAIEDLPRLVSMAEDIRRDTGTEILSVFGVRPSLERPMGWVRQEWERLTNRILVDLADFLMAASGEVVDKRYWNGYELDAQSGYRLYSREAAKLAVEALAALPSDPKVFVFACELVPFLELVLSRGILGQVQRLTLIEQPVSSFRGVAFSECYGSLLAYLCKRYKVSPAACLRIFDNHLVTSSLYFSEFRDELLNGRQQIAPGAPPRLPRFL